MHLDRISSPGDDGGVGGEELLVAVRDAAREACHLADIAGRSLTDAADAAREASMTATRAVFALEDAMRATPGPLSPLAEALGALTAAEEALGAARAALEADLARSAPPRQGSPRLA